MKKLLYLLLILILLPVILLVVAYIYRGELVKYAINKYVPEAVGIPLSVSGVVIEPKTGHFEVQGLNIGNPAGFVKDNLITFGKIAVDLDMSSISTDKVIVKSVDIDKPVINFEMKSLTANNINAFIKTMNRKIEDEKKQEGVELKPVKDQPNKAPAKSFVLDLVNITSGNVEAAVDISGTSNSLAVPLPTITLNKIGENKSENLAEVSSDILKTILQKAMQAVMSSDQLDLKKIANENMGGIVEKVKEKAGLFGIFGNKTKKK